MKLILINYFQKNGKNLKNIALAGDLNIKFLDFKTNKSAQDFLNLKFCYNMISLDKYINGGNLTLSKFHRPHYH